MTGLAPPTAVLSAFGVRGPATPLAGGQGRSWLADDIVLKGDVDSAVQEWLGVHFGEIEQDAFRLRVTWGEQRTRLRIATTQERVNSGVKRDLLAAEADRYRRAASALGL